MFVASLVILAVIATATTITYATYAATKDQKEINEINNHIAQLKEEIKNDKIVIENYEIINGKLVTAVEYLQDAHNQFTKGGCAYPHVPFNSDFVFCINKLDNAVLDISNQINQLSKNIQEYENKITERKNRIKEIEQYMAKQAEAQKEASKRQHERRDGALGKNTTSTTTTTRRHR